ncbi:MAG: C40 family peptidase [Ilumatobacteraceae bacterium]
MKTSSAPRRRFAPAGLALALLAGAAVGGAMGGSTASAADASSRPAPTWSPMESVPVGLRGAQSGPLADEPLAALARFALDTQLQVDRSGDADAVARFGHLRDAQAAMRLDLDPLAVQMAGEAADTTHQLALLAALTQLGTPYHRYSETPEEGFDCSGLTGWAWEQAGVAIPRSSWEQIRASGSRTSGTAQAGDLVYYPGHIMMWLGVGRAVVHARQTGDPVMVDFFAERRVDYVRYGSPTV